MSVVLVAAWVPLVAQTGSTPRPGGQSTPQTRTPPRTTARAPARRPAPLPPLKTEEAAMMCPNPLGQGVQTRRTFCDVLTGREPADGIPLLV